MPHLCEQVYIKWKVHGKSSVETERILGTKSY
jgi:hypothetical protein